MRPFHTTTGGKSKKTVHFNDDSNMPSFTPTQHHDRSPSAASDDTDETITPSHPSPYTFYRSLESSSDIGDFSSSQSTLLSDEEPLYMADTSSPSVPLLRRQSPSPSASIPEMESQPAQGEQLVGYGTTIAPSARRIALQQTQPISYRYPSGQTEVERYVHPRWQSLWRWLRGTNTTTQSTNQRGSTTGEEGAHPRCESEDSSTISTSKKITTGFQMLTSKIHDLCNSAECSATTNTVIQTGKSLSFMLILAVVVFAIGYGVYKLAMVGRRDR